MARPKKKDDDSKPSKIPLDLDKIHATKKHLMPVFIEKFQEYGTILTTCEKIGIDPKTFRYWRKKFPEFDEAVVEADDKLTERLERKAVNNALAGNDTLLIFLLKSRRPKKYRGDGGNISISINVSEIAKNVGVIISKHLPDSCPHCHQSLDLKKPIVSELQYFASKQENMPSTDI